jgi:hypothetical protein
MIRFPIEALFYRVVEKNTMKIATTSDLLLATAFLDALTRLLKPQGVCIMQTLHPVAFSKDGEYADGWKPGTWAGLPGNFGKPAPWYFRTLAGWLSLCSRAGATLREVRELSIDGQFPQSIIFVIESTQRAP